MKLDFGGFDKAYNADVKLRIDEKEKRKNKLKHRRMMAQNIALATIAVVFVAILVNIILGYINISATKYNNNVLARQIDELNEEIEDLQAKIEQKTQNSLIENVAKESFGLAHPSQDQIQVINMNEKFALKEKRQDDIVGIETAKND